MLSVTGLNKSYDGRDILCDIDMTLRTGEVVGLIGRSGAGKSTLARCLVGLETPERGQVRLDGVPIQPGRGRARKDVQYLWQDPVQSLSPYLSAQAAVLETLNGFAIGVSSARHRIAVNLLTDLGVTHDMQLRRPHGLSGGQCQRVALARALAAEPKVLILDEPLSALDLPMQIQAIELLRQVQRARDMTMLIVSHDLAPLRQLASRILVLDDARIVEDLPFPQLSEQAQLPLSRAHADTLK